MNPLIQKFGEEKRWVNWRLEMVKGKMTKVPYQPNGRKADSTVPSTWSAYNEVTGEEKRGFMAGLDQRTLLVDIDHCLEGNVITHEQKQQIAEFIIESGTYTEISPSGTGLHLYFSLSDPLTLIAHKVEPYEVYADKRFFTFSGNHYKESLPVRTITSIEVLELLSIIGYPWGRDKKVDAKKHIEINADDETIIQRMFRAKNGVAVKAVYNGETYKNDLSRADASLCTTLAFYTGCNAPQMERIWASSPLGNREKTTSRKDYRDRTIKFAIDNCKEVYKTSTIKTIEKNSEIFFLTALSPKKDIIIIQNTENICKVLRQHPNYQGRLRYDSFKIAVEIKENGKWRSIIDHDTLIIQTEISILFPCFVKVLKEMVGDAISVVSKENSFDSAVDWIKSLVWDKQSRLDNWLVKSFNVLDDEYHKKVGSNWFKGLVKRLVHPGSKFDYVLCLEGEQGSKKTTALGIIGGDWHVETTQSVDNKDFFMQFQGKAIIEFSEGETLSRADIKKLKAIITMRTDRFRPPYGRLSVDFPRRCVFAMTTNQDEYLKDETGNRRWLPVKCIGEVDTKWLEENREQLYAEAYQKVIIDNETTWEFPLEETLQAQNDRMVKDANTDVVVDWYFGKLTRYEREEGITIHQVFNDCLNNGGFGNKAMEKRDEMSIAGILRVSLNLEKRQRMDNGVRKTRWFLKGSPEIMLTVDPKKEDELKEFISNPNQTIF